jgi:hypothetical protein
VSPHLDAPAVEAGLAEAEAVVVKRVEGHPMNAQSEVDVHVDPAKFRVIDELVRSVTRGEREASLGLYVRRSLVTWGFVGQGRVDVVQLSVQDFQQGDVTDHESRSRTTLQASAAPISAKARFHGDGMLSIQSLLILINLTYAGG